MHEDHKKPQPRWWRRLKQDITVLVHLFPWRVAGVLVLIIGITAAVYGWQLKIHEGKELTPVKAVYAVFNMILLQLSYADMPEASELDIFFVLAPLVGIPLFLVFGANILNILRIFFIRRERGQRWQVALADTIERPIIVCGVGRVGYRVANQLLDLGRPTIGIEAVPSSLVDTLMERGMPVIFGDIRNEEVLRSAGVARARTVLVCTHDDLSNIEGAFRVRELNPDANIVLRLFEDEISEEIKRSFDIRSVISRSALAAQAFAHAAIGLEILETFENEQQVYVLAKVPLGLRSPLLGQKTETVAEDQDVTIVCLYREGRLIIEPDPETILRIGDTLFVYTSMTRLATLTNGSDAANDTCILPSIPCPIIVCGLGHTGYRVVKAIQALQHPVIAVDFEPSRLSERLQEMGVQVIFGDFRQRSMLESIGISHAMALIGCTEDDMANFEAALRARELNPNIRIIMRIFEESLGERLQQAFNIDTVYSTSAIAAPAFVAAALKIRVTPQPVTVGEEAFYIAPLVIETLSNLYRESIAALTREEDLTILMHKRGDQVYIPPRADQILKVDDEIVILASQEKLRELSLRNRGSRDID